MRCSAITKGGSRCRLEASHGSYCYQHSPETVEARRLNASKGGRGRSPSGLAEIAAIKADIRAVIDRLVAGSVENGAVLFQGFNVLLRAVDVGRKIRDQDEILLRLEELEDDAYQNDSAQRRWGR